MGNSLHSAGLGILLHENDNTETDNTELDPNGRYMCVSCKISGRKFCFVNVQFQIGPIYL